MARKYGPLDGSPFYEVENRRLQRAFNPLTGFVKSGQGAVTAGTGAQLVIAAYPDGALIDGLYVENPTSETVTLTTNTASMNPRIDRLVMRLDMGAKTIEPFQIVGTPAPSPQAPPLVQTANVYDMPLCQYRFPGSGSAQNPGSIVNERPVLGEAEAWQAYTPIWGTVGVAPSLAAGGTLVGRYYKTGRLCHVEIALNWQAGSSGGTGDWSFTLPFPAASTVEQELAVKSWNRAGQWAGVAFIPVGANVANPLLPFSTTRSDLGRVRNADGTGVAGTGVPQASGGFTFDATGHNLIIFGSYETAS